MGSAQDAKTTHQAESQYTAEDDKMDSLRAFILDRWQRFDHAPQQYQWLWETERWHELVFCLLFRLGEPELPPSRARSLTGILASLDMLSINDLAGHVDDRGEVDFTHPDLILMMQILQRTGMDTIKAQAIVTTICQTALGLLRHYDGKVQRYLRHYGQQMLDALSQYFSYIQIAKEDMQHAFTHWLQNVLNMPVAVSEPAIAKFCETRGISAEELLQVADELNINVALLDDMIASYVSEDLEDQSGQEESLT